MCTLIWLYRPEHPIPIVLAHHRDERRDRPWRMPADHWPQFRKPTRSEVDMPRIWGGQDIQAGGSWMACHQYGCVAILLNRFGSLGPEQGKLSRGELVLTALSYKSASVAAYYLSETLKADQFRPFTLILMDRLGVFSLSHHGETKKLSCQYHTPGLHMVAAHDVDDMKASDRLRVHLPLWQNLPVPEHAADHWQKDQGWQAWGRALGSRQQHDSQGDYGAMAAMSVARSLEYGSLCASFLSIDQKDQIVWQFSDQAMLAGCKPHFHTYHIS